MHKRIVLKGKDYSLIDEIFIDGKPLENYATEKEKWFKPESPYETEIKIINCFLEEVDRKVSDPKGEFVDIIGNNSDTERGNKRRLFADFEATNENFKKRLGGLVGIFREKEFRFSDNTEDTYDIELRISCRFDGDKKPFFLIYMLSKCFDIPLSMDEIDAGIEDFFEFLMVILFKNKLEEAYEGEFFKTYQRFQKNDDRLKGAIDISRHIRMNMGMANGKVAYSYRENTVDNYINHLIIHTYMQLKRVFPKLVQKVFGVGDTAMTLSELRYRAPSFDQFDVRTVMQKSSNPISHPYYQNYEELRKTCIKILQHIGISIFSDEENDNVQSMLFYVPDLWEVYLKTILERVKPNELTLKVQDENKIKIMGAVQKIPDFVFMRGENPELVLDAKFKQSWEEEKWEFLKDDIMQCIVYMTIFNAKATGVIYPTNQQEGKVKDQRISHYQEKLFYMIGLEVPESDSAPNGTEWGKRMRDSENKFKEYLENLRIFTEYDSGCKV
ncbi:MAG: hypothetical protein PHR06_10450 [Candidatus Cloacimonetes bacterium]|nr:hypothetical protein [Candidatus Cloacimonadota bacterium]